MEKHSILIVDDEQEMRNFLKDLLSFEGYTVETAADGKEALRKMEKNILDFILCDVRMPDMDGMEFLRQCKSNGIQSPIIMMSAFGTVDTAIEAMKAGAFDYVSKPFKEDEVLLTLKKAEERQRLLRENESLKREVHHNYGFESMIAKSASMLQIFQTIQKIADYKTTVLILGESGTGKELVAKALHYNSQRSGGSFVTVNCGAIPENLLESELFGHVKGAFTGATQTKKGLFEEAHGGTLFLDEIGELPLMLQVKLLRVLQEEEIRRVGDTRPIKVDVRIVAATIRNLEQEMKEGRFREDLFYRLNVMPIHIPPLRERREDIPLLVEHFVVKYNQRMEKTIQGVDSPAMKMFMEYDWKGNVRELENAIERATVLTKTDKIKLEDLPTPVQRGYSPRGPLLDTDLSVKKATREMEVDLIQRALQKTHGNRTHAAKLLEISHRALLYKIKEYELGHIGEGGS
ncbi:MAG: sigma-54-dependent Fis family transcriptional regulator [Deltaproteobacteria bacterium]|nr:sigma-54-dependent Fis family transcriptional regulator [Deltaproteobacteria bacterium]